MDGEDFSQRYTDALSEMEARYLAERDALDANLRLVLEREEARVLGHLDALLDDAARGRAAAFRAEMSDAEARFRAGAVGEAAAPASIDDLEVRSLHLLAKLDSALRHSIVEACLMNLRGFAEVLDEKADDPTFLERVGAQVGLLPGVAQQVVDFFQRPVVCGLAIKDLLPVAYKVALAAVRGVLWVAERFQAAGGDAPPVPGRELSRRIDELTAALTEVRRVLDARRLALGSVVRKGVEALRPVVEAAGGRLVFDDRTQGGARLFVNETRVINVVGELVRNACRHGREDAPGGPTIRVTVAEDPVPATTVRVVVEDDGSGFADDVLARAGDEAVSTSGGGAGLGLVREAAAEHFGSVELGGGEGGGARVSIVLPRHPPATPPRNGE